MPKLGWGILHSFSTLGDGWAKSSEEAGSVMPAKGWMSAPNWEPLNA